MTARAKTIPFLVALAVACTGTTPATAADYLIPPENSAATQYTEGVPTAGGQRDAERERDQTNRTPSQVLGPRTTNDLESLGRDGREAAEFAAETAPHVSGSSSSPSSDRAGAPASSGDRTSGTDDNGNNGRFERGGSDGLAPAHLNGSGAFTEVLEAAFGGSSGGLGLLLPLGLIAAAAWAVLGHRARRRGNG